MAHLKSNIQSCVYYLSLGSETLKFTRSISDTFMKLSNKSLKTIQEEDCKLDHNVHVQKNILSILHLFQCFFRGIRYLHQIFLSSFTWSCTYIPILFFLFFFLLVACMLDIIILCLLFFNSKCDVSMTSINKFSNSMLFKIYSYVYGGLISIYYFLILIYLVQLTVCDT